MPATTNALQWNPTQANQESDTAYAADSERTGGAVSGQFPSALGNKLFYQLSTYITALATMLANKGYSNNDSNLANLVAVMNNLVTNADLSILSLITNPNMHIVTGTRSFGVTYKNTGTIAMDVVVSGLLDIGHGTGQTVTIQGRVGSSYPSSIVATDSTTNGSGYCEVHFKVPVGYYYGMYTGGIGPGDSASATLASWVEWGS
jgi:hypothetical protein